MSRVLSVFWSEKSLLGESAKQFKASFPSQTILLERGYKIWLDWALKYVRTGLDQLSEDYKRQYAALTKRDQEQLREQFISKRESFYEGCLKKGLSILSGDKQEDYRKRVSHWYEEVDQKGLEYLNILPASKVEEPTEHQSLVLRGRDDLVRASSREGVVLTFSREEQQLLGCQQIEEILFFENKAGDLEQMLENISRYGELQIRQAEEKLRQVNESRPSYLLEGSRSYKDFCSRVDKVKGELLKKVRPLLHPDGIARLDIEESYKGGVRRRVEESLTTVEVFVRSKVESLTDAKAEEREQELFEAYVLSQKSRPDLAELQEEIKRRRAERAGQLYRLQVLDEMVEEARRKRAEAEERAEAERKQREEAQERAEAERKQREAAQERAEAERKQREESQREVEELKRQLEAMKRSARLRSQEEEPEIVEGRSFRR